MRRFSILVCLSTLLAPDAGAQDGDTSATPLRSTARWQELWYSGEAELNRFTATRERYGEPRAAEIVLLFVTEDFDAERQVKDEHPVGRAAIPIMKANYIERFQTGVYDYSAMVSTFADSAPGERPGTLKATASVQDWCGHVWLQANRRDGALRIEGRSYFEAEGDESFAVADTWLEDGLPLRLRCNGPQALPTGEISVVPGLLYSRLNHARPSARPATATLEDAGDGRRRYVLDYGDRQLELEFDAALPFRIERIIERIAGRVTLEATRTHTEWLPYWKQQNPSGGVHREELGVETRLGPAGGG